MKTRATITIKGKVQKVGFRSFVKKHAVSMGITGYALNMPDNTVLVVSEGEEAVVSNFLDSIKKSQFYMEGVQTNYSKPTGEFKGFERIGEDVPKKGATLDDVVDVLKSFDSKAEELVKMQRETVDVIKEGNKELGEKLGGKIDGLGKELGGKIDGLGEKTDDFHHDMSRRFDTVEDKYGIIAEMIGKAVEGIEKTNKNMEKNMESILKETSGNTEKILTRMEKQQEKHNQLMEKLIGAIANKS